MRTTMVQEDLCMLSSEGKCLPSLVGNRVNWPPYLMAANRPLTQKCFSNNMVHVGAALIFKFLYVSMSLDLV